MDIMLAILPDDKGNGRKSEGADGIADQVFQTVASPSGENGL